MILLVSLCFAQNHLGGQFKSGQLGSFQNRPTEVARNC